MSTTEFVPRQQLKFIGGPLDGVAMVQGTATECFGTFRMFAVLVDSDRIFPANEFPVEYSFDRLAYCTAKLEHRYQFERGAWVHAGSVKRGA